MGMQVRQSAFAKRLSTLQADLAQQLEETHLSAWAADTLLRSRFVAELATGLSRLEDTHVSILPGSAITDLYSFCTQLETALGTERIRRSVEGPRGVIEALGYQPIQANGRALRRRFLIWDDAHVLMSANNGLFGRLVEAMLGVSGELEYASDDLLLLQRVILVGAPSLDLYAEDRRSALSRWSSARAGSPTWKRLTGLKAPPVLRVNIAEAVAG